MRQDEFRDAHSARAFQRLEDHDRRRRHRLDANRDGRLYAVNPENGYFGVVPGTNYKSNPNAMRSIEHDTIYTNVALTTMATSGGRAKTAPRRPNAFDWRAIDWTPQSKEKAAHPNSRFTTPMRNNPVLDSDVDEGEGVPISAIIFGGRRSDTVPLVYQAFDWDHGVYFGATMASETTAAADRRGRASAPRSDGDAAVLRIQHRRLFSATGWTWESGSRTRRASST